MNEFMEFCCAMDCHAVMFFYVVMLDVLLRLLNIQWAKSPAPRFGGMVTARNGSFTFV